MPMYECADVWTFKHWSVQTSAYSFSYNTDVWTCRCLNKFVTIIRYQKFLANPRHFIFFRNESLFTYESIISMCSLESTRLRSPPQFKDLCETKGPAHCCPGWSLGGYIGIMNNRSSCFNIRVRHQITYAQ